MGFDNKDKYFYCGVEVDLTRDSNLTEQGLRYLTTEGFYKKPNETTPQETLARGAACYSFGDKEFAKRIYDYASKQHFAFASPVLSNAVAFEWPEFTKEQFPEAGDWLKDNIKPDGLPISCFLNLISDSKEGLTVNSAETKELSMAGGGVGVFMGNRSPDTKSTGVMAHAKEYDATALAYKQAASRRGSIALYMNVDHPEVINFLGMRDPTGGDMNKKCFNLNHGLNITDKFMRAVVKGERFPLVDPKHGNTGQDLGARELWEKILETRKETGEPYLLFIDTVNKSIPEWVTKPTYKVSQSNLCVAPETQLLTKGGWSVISTLEGQSVEVWNGGEWSETVVHKTGTNQHLLKVTTEDGKELQSTPYHKWYVHKELGEPLKEVRTTELEEGDLVYSTTGNLNDITEMVLTKVLSVVDEGRYDDIYCLNEPKRHMAVFNGILTGQCSEILLMTSFKRSAVCCLSSLNLDKYDEWKDTPIVEDLVRLLDNVLEYFIRLAPPSLKRAIHSAMKERAIGLGTLGFHSLLQSKNIPIESDEARRYNMEIFKGIKEKAVATSLLLGKERGEVDDCRNTGMRNSHLLAIAPNASSSSIVGASPSIEPWKANVFLSEGRAGSVLIKNKYLEELLDKLGKNTKKVWDSILVNEGSVQHLDFLDSRTKEVFKTAMEIDQMKLVNLVADRTPLICQSQSFNVFINNTMTAQEVSDIHLYGWKKGIKSFYYCRGDSSSKASIGTGGDKPLNAVPVELKQQEVVDEGLPCCEG